MFDTVTTTVLGPALLAILGWFLHRQLNRAKTQTEAKRADTEDVKATAALLESQRKDFEALLDPMREELKRLRNRLADVEADQRGDQHIKRHAFSFIRRQQTQLRVHAPEHQLPIPEQLTDYI